MVDIDVSPVKAFMDKLSQAGSGALKSEISTWIDGLGVKFLTEVQNEISAKEVVESRALLNSFQKGGPENVFELSGDGLQVRVGTNLYYAFWVENGHHQDERWVPGAWTSSGRFEYNPGAKTGMKLTAKWIPGRFFFKSARRSFEAVLPNEIKAKVGDWLKQMLGG